jgi:hypothetical protein
MGRPQVEIEVDDVTGRWSVDGLPMILVPQHFLLNNHYAIEAVLGPEKLEQILRPEGHRSAYFWCEQAARHHGMSGIQVFCLYLRRISQRGWGQFDLLELASETGVARVRVRHSAIVDEAHRMSGRRLCYMFSAWLEGALEYVAASAGRRQHLRGREAYCAAEGAHDHCLFEISSPP